MVCEGDVDAPDLGADSRKMFDLPELIRTPAEVQGVIRE